MPSLPELLNEAKLAQHKLLTGTAVASARDQNGEEVRYTQASAGMLAGYIAELERQIAAAAGTTQRPLGPMRFHF